MKEVFKLKLKLIW